MKIKVLVADDEKDFAETLAERLTLRNFAVTAVFSGESALELIKEVDFDVIILDVLMPGLSGIELLKEIKNIKPLAQVIMLTGAATVTNAIQGMKLGAYDFLMKPADTDILEEKIKDAHDIKVRHEERIRKAEIDTILKQRGW